MANAPSYSKSGVKSATPIKLDKAVFAVELSSHDLIKSAYDSYLANGRGNLAVSKTRAAVSGGGKKPWRQKGTGRARAGSIRSPIWRSGGVVFGPTGKENYARKMHSTTKRQALRQALSLSASEGRIKVLETSDFKQGKTGDATKLLGKLEATGRTLFVVSSKDDLALRATRNLANVKLVQANYLNVYDVVNAEHLIIDKKSLEIISEQLGQTKAKTETAATKTGDKK